MTQAKAYRRAEWLSYRDEVLRLDDYECSRCGRQQSEGVILHVHHKQYLRDHKPWEYPHDLCGAMCAACHAAEHGHIPPQDGWTLAGTDDLGGLYGNCQRCHAQLRHVHFVVHPRWHPLEVGTNCCDALTGTVEASEHRKFLERRKRFVSSTRWELDGRNAETIEHKNVRVSCVGEHGIYRIRVRGRMGRLAFGSASDAKAHAFSLLDSGELKRWMNEKS